MPYNGKPKYWKCECGVMHINTYVCEECGDSRFDPNTYTHGEEESDADEE